MPTRDLSVPPGPGLPQGLVIPAAELVERFSRSSGPGGQGVNTTDSRVQLSWSPVSSAALTESQRSRVVAHLGARLVDGAVTVDASEHRSQRRNRVAARERLAADLRAALAPPPPARRATKPTKGSQRRRLAAKARRSDVKSHRARPARDD
ncbi:alternative ribosome rescue aminoacyl-tRNA hydrolase ArfB [Arsenicicoccus dermatophilus]|uniref:alternative ribosome rescue aminoacyl-tRNA hydrolase ArfB n=1 Tax=Arsenicicoccus dermatophilus TaxID=1076331 RepID=UPI001F4CFB43|nr:alternative ribosome rescue aminoacyl-tRNA hydrolase ArfB [Arsenicicoccus dermatophilus]MCH8613502.1 aminoacyl-tRNA hydrolase [Arsenicicoccus dermatophilus]